MPNCWSAAASTGTVDERAQNFIRLGRLPGIASFGGGNAPDFADPRFFGAGDSIISLVPNVPKGAYSVRYGVIPVGDPTRGDTTFLEVRYLVDNHDAGRLVVLLKKYNLASPPSGEVAEIIAVFDSQNHAPSPKFQLQSSSTREDFDFLENAYFVEALLINTKDPPLFPLPTLDDGKHPSPALAAVRVCRRGTIDN